MDLSSTRREFLGRTSAGIGSAALALLLRETGFADTSAAPVLHFAPRAKRVILLTQAGAPSQIDLFDHKPGLVPRRGQLIPDSVRMGQRVTTMTSSQAQKLGPSEFAFARHGQSGAWFSELLPHTSAIADELCIVKSLHTDLINHAPAMTFF
jgi:hypothetical protein